MITKHGILVDSSPTMETEIFDGQVTVVGYGKQYDEPEFHWSLRTLNVLRDVIERETMKKY